MDHRTEMLSRAHLSNAPTDVFCLDDYVSWLELRKIPHARRSVGLDVRADIAGLLVLWRWIKLYPRFDGVHVPTDEPGVVAGLAMSTRSFL